MNDRLNLWRCLQSVYWVVVFLYVDFVILLRHRLDNASGIYFDPCYYVALTFFINSLLFQRYLHGLWRWIEVLVVEICLSVWTKLLTIILDIFFKNLMCIRLHCHGCWDFLLWKNHRAALVDWPHRRQWRLTTTLFWGKGLRTS